MGMTATEFWDGDPDWAVQYRLANDIKNQRDDQNAWLCGAYIYHALCDVAPILQAFAKRGTKAKPYLTEPFGVFEKKKDDEAESGMETLRKKAMERFELINASFKKADDGRS